MEMEVDAAPVVVMVSGPLTVAATVPEMLLGGDVVLSVTVGAV
jgi:hypothetical protein